MECCFTVRRDDAIAEGAIENYVVITKVNKAVI